ARHEAKTFRNLNLEFPDDIERDEVEPVCREVALQRSGERSPVSPERTGACVHRRPPKAGGYVMIDLVLDARAISQLAIYGQDGETVRRRNRRTVVSKSRRPQPFF